MIPSELKTTLSQILPAPITSGTGVPGGSINSAAKLQLQNHQDCFLKWNTAGDPAMFIKEKNGLQQLRSAETSIRIPDVLIAGKTETGTGFLVLEYVEEGNSLPESAARFGEALAALHRHRNDRFGLSYDNFIGRLPQSNAWHDSWVDFFIYERIEPQLRMAVDAHKLPVSTIGRFKSIFKKLPDIFPQEPPGLLHGDLWSGNYMYDTGGRPVIYDPAVYYGHREIELAFTYLFGGFSSAFYKAYNNAYPLISGFGERKDLYNLYPLLVHTNLFGGRYTRQVEAIAAQFD